MAKSVKKKASNGKIDNVKIRMYCLGTGDCFIYKFCHGATEEFTMMIDCGSCQGTPADFEPYVKHLIAYVKNHIDLLVVTHEHNDHVNGFAKCEDLFASSALTINEAWFAWTEDPEDPGGRAKKLQEKRKKMRMAFAGAIAQFKQHAVTFKGAPSNDYYKAKIDRSNDAFLSGLETLAEINLPANGEAADKSLPGMRKIKEILADKKTDEGKKTRISYLNPGQSVTIDGLNGFKFHVLGPPAERDFIFKEGKQGTDVYKKKLNYYESALAATSFINQDKVDIREKDIPFDEKYIVNEKQPSLIAKISSQTQVMQPVSNTIIASYNKEGDEWRKIDADWLSSAGTLALRLNSHINNTSLALAVESTETKQVLLLPGDAEYGSWESWHAIDVWKKKGKGGIHFVEDLLNRTIFYKVGHHLSYNGTALKLGIEMMPTSGLTAMATLDRTRIAKNWKSTMPNKFLMQELIKRCDGRVYIMEEKDITNPPSDTLDPTTLSKSVYETAKFKETDKVVYKQCTVKIHT